MPVALLTGASKGFGRAVAAELARRGWTLITDARDPDALRAATAELAGGGHTALPGDVTDPAHRAELAAAVERAGRLDLLVHNASDLGPSPLPHLASYPVDAFRRVLEVGTVAPLALTQLVLPALTASGGTLISISSDAAVAAYEGWGGYGAAKAALDQLTA